MEAGFTCNMVAVPPAQVDLESNMARILFFVYPNIGSQIASMKLAADLKAHGHHVCYLGIKDSEAYIRANGFDFVPVFEEHFPEGYLEDQISFDTMPMGISYLLALREIAKGFKTFIQDLAGAGGERFMALLRELRPDLMVFASAEPQIEWIAMLACSMGIRGIYFNDMLKPYEDLGFPPPGSSLIPNRSLRSRVRIFLAWKRLQLRLRLDDILSGVDVPALTRRLASHYGWRRSHDSDGYKRDRLLRLPEIVSFPPEFDFPGAQLPGAYYTQPFIYLDRIQPPFPWERLNPHQPVVYGALGSVLPMGNKVRRINFYRTFIDAAVVRPDWNWVLVIGNNMRTEDLGPVPNNVVIVSSAPQLQLLERSALMITHGGANSIKECIYFGVPMIVFPFLAAQPIATDQPGNAAKVIYHGLGAQADHSKLTAEYLGNLVDTVDRDPYIRAQVKTMQAIFRQAEQTNSGLRLLETFLPRS